MADAPGVTDDQKKRPLMVSPVRQAAALLAAARRDGVKLDDLPAELRPRDLDEAYAIQDAFVGLIGPIGGWKVGAAPGGGVLVAPIADAFIHRQAAAPVVPAPARLEVELAVTLAADLPARGAPYLAADMAPVIAAAYVVIEILGHRFVAQDNVSALTYLADGNGNAGVIVGDAIASWRSLDLARLDVALSVGGFTRGRRDQGDGGDALMDLLGSLANHSARHAGGLRAGQVVITGARFGPVAVAGGVVEGSINGTSKVTAKVG